MAVRFDTTGASGAAIVIDGLDAVYDACDAVGPELRRRLDRDVGEAVARVARAAAARVDSRTGRTAAGYRVSRRRGVWRVVNRELGATILEFAQTPRCRRGETLIRTLDAKYGPPGRILWHSWERLGPSVAEDVQRIIRDAEMRIESAGV